MRLRRKLVTKRILLRHVIQQYQPIPCLIRSHFIKINLLNKKEHLRPNLTHHTPLERYHFLLLPIIVLQHVPCQV